MAKKQSNETHPIRDIETLRNMKTYLHRKNVRDYLLLNVMLNTGLRISDTLALKVRDVRNKERLSITIQKTGLRYDQRLNGRLRSELDFYTASFRPDDYVFQSQKGGQLSRSQAHRILSQAGKHVGIERVSSHSIRKSYAYHNYQQNHDIAALMQILGHKTPAVTMRYIGLSTSDIDTNIENFYI